MMLNDEERRGLIQFVPPNFLRVSVLVIEAAEILSAVRKILPAAQIALLTVAATPDTKKICDEVRADLFIGDWTSLPPAPKVFELIIAPAVLSTGKFFPTENFSVTENFYAPLITLNCLLKDSGALLTMFDAAVLSERDVVKILDDALYKEIIFSGRFIRAGKCTAEVAALKDFFTPEVRAELSRLLHRIEYDIDTEKNFLRLKEFCRREGIFAEYLTDFIEQVVVHAAAKKFLAEQM